MGTPESRLEGPRGAVAELVIPPSVSEPLWLPLIFVSQTDRIHSMPPTFQSSAKACPIPVGLIVLRCIYFSRLALFVLCRLLADQGVIKACEPIHLKLVCHLSVCPWLCRRASQVMPAQGALRMMILHMGS